MPRDLTSESFAKLLGTLSSNEAEAAVVYADLHESLVRYFQLKGISAPDKAADETIDRIPERINETTKPEDVKYIAFSIAKFVFLEKIRSAQKQTRADDGFYLKTGAMKKFDEKDDFESLLECFKKLYRHEQELLVNYFSDLTEERISENRQKLADREEIDLNALRNRVSRLRRRLEDCLGKKK